MKQFWNETNIENLTWTLSVTDLDKKVKDRMEDAKQFF